MIHVQRGDIEARLIEMRKAQLEFGKQPSCNFGFAAVAVMIAHRDIIVRSRGQGNAVPW